MRRYYQKDNGFRPTHAEEKAWWVDVTDPGREDADYLTSRLGVPPMFLEYLRDDDERARVERDGAWMMTIIRIPVESRDETMPYRTVPLGVISGTSDRVITVCYHRSAMLSDFAGHTCKLAIDVPGVAEFTLRMFYSTAFWYLSYLKTLSEEVVGAEKALRRSIENRDLIWLMEMQKSLVFFNTSIKGNVLVLERIQKIYGEELDEELYEDVEIELHQADTTVEIYSNILEGTTDAYASIISNNMNNVMKRMTGLTIILMVPTFIASLYGMNVDILLGDSPFAFWIILAIAALLTILAYFLLRRIKWF
ncbi:MAG: magnesium transporter CorA family protein [Clostridium sp.]|nr:magnesium transporter CorA family protein [Clostridium sp.]